MTVDDRFFPAHVLRSMGRWVPPEISDDTLVRVTMQLDGDMLEYVTEVQATGYVEAIDVEVKIN